MIKFGSNKTTYLDDKQTEAGVEKPEVVQVAAEGETDNKAPLQSTTSPTSSSRLSMVLTKMKGPKMPPPILVRDAGTPPTLQMKDTTKAYLGQNTRARSEELHPDMFQGTLQPGGKARRDAEADKTPAHNSALPGGPTMNPKSHKLPQDSPGSKERNKSTNLEEAVAVQASAQTTDTSEAHTHIKTTKFESNETTKLENRQTEAGVEKPLVMQVLANGGTDT